MFIIPQQNIKNKLPVTNDEKDLDNYTIGKYEYN